ncbi:amidohydrolase family protein [Streptomyces sp. CHA1]|nr:MULTISPECIES: amidohydrolase family protein [Streptomyces]QOZ99984.1 amidohydrolase family protein [Streptomyces violascens]UYM24675.1 amidohydrolase family protein [Streptomyces albus]WDV31926.1 amidohydrolase family protein [Streptomyces sp. AD16]ESP99104.1 amidohydrolase [Streptomyces sp. GBA 94-10 4N24]ESQ04932.1 amidohydrolase [Streptomyces sp. PVA_94-07]
MLQRIEAEKLIPGRGTPVEDGVVLFDEHAITYAGPAADAPETPQADVVRAPVVMPGLWECHGHFMGLRSADLSLLPQESVALRAARITSDLRAALDAGVTSVRETGGLGIHLVRAIEEGTVQGPSVYPAGTTLSTTGGHADLHSYPVHWVEDFGHLGGELRLADGPAECARAAREQLRRNAKLIKVCASGGVLSEVDHPVHQQFTHAELRAIVEVAGMADRIVAAHCHGKPGIMASLEAGVTTIEHGTYIDEEAAVAMRECGAILVTTRTIFQELLDNGHMLPAYALEKLRATAGRHEEAVAIAREQGVTIAAGSDVALSGSDLPDSWGRNGRELPLLVKTGMTPLEAIEAGTATGPATLGPQGPRSGQLREGYDSDVLVLDEDPLADIEVIARPERITGVWKAGVRVK